MPLAAKRPCSQPGCPALSYDRFCPVHKKAAQKAQDERRGTAASRGYGSRWRSASKAFLACHPLCRNCLQNDRVTQSTVTDHIIPHKGDMVLFWDRSNWQALCKHCHDVKTAKEDGGFGR